MTKKECGRALRPKSLTNAHVGHPFRCKWYSYSQLCIFFPLPQEAHTCPLT